MTQTTVETGARCRAILGLVGLLGSVSTLASATLAADGHYVRTKDAVVLPLKDGRLTLQVYADDTIRVRFAPLGVTPDQVVPTIIGTPQRVRWSVSESRGALRLKTPRMVVLVDEKSGLIRFCDRDGKTVLSELPTQRLRPNRVGEFATLQTSGRFALSPGEAIYGLGQHQQGVMNYRGTQVVLRQENREIAVPMLVSSQGYGVLWNNPSVTKVNVAGSEEEATPSSMLRDETGAPGGLTARYYEGENFERLVDTRKDAQIDFNWGKTPPPGLGHDHYSVRWTGFLVVPKTGDYTLTATGDDGIRLSLEGRVIAEDWHTRAVVTVRKRVHLIEGRRYPLQFDFYQALYDSVVQFGIAKPPVDQALSWTSEAGRDVDYVFFYGPNLERVLASYRQLTGQAPMFARWAWGLWQSRERYASQQELLDVAGRYRADHIPLDGIIQDWQYWTPKPWGSHQFDPVRYPDPMGLMSALHAENVHALISVWPKFDAGIDNAKELIQAGGMYTKVIPYVYPTGQGQWYDPFSPSGRKVYWRQIAENLARFHFDGWWLDASEPELSGAWGEFRDFQTGAGPGALVYNAYPLMHTTAVYQGQRAETAKHRAIILTRSAYAGQQRNGAISWSGDITANWATLQQQVPAGLNFSLSGIPYWNTDTGGFFAYAPVTDPDYQDLFARWFEFSTFVPMLRIHGTGTAKEIWRWPEPTRKTLIAFDRLRYHLLSYLYSTAWSVTSEGSSMLRPLILDFRSDPKVFEIGDETMFGPNLLVAPVTTPKATERKVYLPKGTSWIDFWTGQTFTGGQTINSDAVDKIPVFARAGAILPYGPDVESAVDNEDPTELRIYPGANGTYRLYNDEGDGYAYEKGAYATIDLHWNDRTRKLTIESRRGHYPGLPSHRTFHIVLVSTQQGHGAPSTPHPDRTVHYHGDRIAVQL